MIRWSWALTLVANDGNTSMLHTRAEPKRYGTKYGYKTLPSFSRVKFTLRGGSDIMNTHEIENFVDGITSTNAETFKHKSHSKRAFKRVSPLGVVLIVFATVGMAVLGGYFYSLMTVTQTGNVDVGGRELTSVFEWDATPIEGGTLTQTLDVGSLTVNEHKSYPHTIENMDMGDWLVTVTLYYQNETTQEWIDFDDITNPMDPLYGITFKSVPNNFIVSPTELVDITFWYNVSHEYMDPTIYGGFDNYDFKVVVTIESASPPVANDDGPLQYSKSGSGTLSMDILANDIDYVGDGLTVSDLTWVGDGAGMTLDFHDGVVWITGWGGVAGYHSFTYTITDAFDLTDTATATIQGV